MTAAFSNKRYGMIRAGAASTRVRVGNVPANVEQHLNLFRDAEAAAIDLLVCPELGTSGYSCGVLFQQDILLDAILAGLSRLKEATHSVFQGVVIVGAALSLDGMLFNCAVVMARGRYLGVVPKRYLPNYKEFSEEKWFASASELRSTEIVLDGEKVLVGTDLLFSAEGLEKFVLGVEVCEDSWVPISPGDVMAAHGATIIANVSASHELVGKAEYRRNLILGKSGAAICGYVYASSGPTESTTDLVFGGHCLIAENGSVLKEGERFARENQITAADIDLDRLAHDRMLTNSTQDNLRSLGLMREFRRLTFPLRKPIHNAMSGSSAGKGGEPKLLRRVDAAPFVPVDAMQLNARCEEIFNIQVHGLASRLESIGLKQVVIGVSGGLDSTHALTVTCKCFDLLGWPRANIHAYTMPGFGTSDRTRTNALQLMGSLGVSASTVDIKEMCLIEMQATNYRPFGIDLSGVRVNDFKEKLKAVPVGMQDLGFENVQARMRTLVLMNAGFVIGTGDLSELALGWCTFNADHMSMYNVNASVPKTLIKFLVQWMATNHFDGVARSTMMDILNTEISPELLPVGASGEIHHKTEELVGPYELNDFFLYYLGRFGTTPEKIFFLAGHARFSVDYSDSEILRWLEHFIQRFFGQQYKRSTMPDGPKVGTISLSPRAEWLMPSDADPAIWLQWVKEAQAYLTSRKRERGSSSLRR
jgi:NAD+ synthase (glutamine-hydrolysing)